MKVLIAYASDIPFDNPFVRTLKKGLESAGCDVNWGLGEFWRNSSKYDVVHIHWPDSLFPNWSPTELEVLFLEQHLQEVRKHAKVVYTRHNEVPHYSQNPNRKKCYEIVERNADAIVHMGNYGLEEFRETLRNDHVEHCNTASYL
jgi:hypothetical protein